MKKVFKGWLPKYSNKQIKNCKTVSDLGHILTESSALPDRKWFDEPELPAIGVMVTVEIKDGS